jgi:hypothetical protein
MLAAFRGKIGTAIVGVIVTFIAAVFVFEGTCSPKVTRGMHEAAVAGIVNDQRISLTEFNRALERRMEFIKQLSGGKITDDQIKQFRVRESTFHEIVQQKLMIQDAEKRGMNPSKEALRQEITKLPYFQKEGKFDPILYKQVLQSNNYSPSQFERMIEEQMLAEAWMGQFDLQAQVSDSELKEEFIDSKTERNVKYVSLMSGSEKKGTFTVQETAQKATEMLKADSKSDAKVNDLLKPYGVTVRETNFISKAGKMVPGLGDQADLMKAVFAEPSPLLNAPKTFTLPGALAVVMVKDAKNPDLQKFDSEKPKLRDQVLAKKKRFLQDSAMKQLIDKASVDSNPEIAGNYVKKES